MLFETLKRGGTKLRGELGFQRGKSDNPPKAYLMFIFTLHPNNIILT